MDGIVSIIISALSFAATSATLLVSIIFYSKNFKEHIMNELMSKYNSEQMGIAVIELWNFHDSNKGNQEKMIEAYRKLLAKKKYTIHNYRRLVSRYYLLVSVYFSHRLIPSKVINRIWSCEDLAIIDKIIIPIDKFINRETRKREVDVRITSLQSFYEKNTKELSSNDAETQKKINQKGRRIRK